MRAKRKSYILAADWIAVLRKAAREGGKIMTSESLSHQARLTGSSLQKALARLEKKGLIERIGPRLFLNTFAPPSLEEMAMVVGRPCYISFESALAHHNILSQLPQVLICATTQKPRTVELSFGFIQFRHMSRQLFWGYKEESGVLWAEPEKALLDWLYWKSKQEGCRPDLGELELDALNQKQLRTWARHYPRVIRKLINKI